MLIISKDPTNVRVLHLVMDIAENVLLPSLMRQLGQIHFTACLKFDFFGVSCSNLEKNYIFGLTEGHWPSGKSSDQTIPMLYFILKMARNVEKTRRADHLVLHADNCAGQNKNRYVFWLLLG